MIKESNNIPSFIGQKILQTDKHRPILLLDPALRDAFCPIRVQMFGLQKLLTEPFINDDTLDVFLSGRR
jgi:hypothetical protein